MGYDWSSLMGGGSSKSIPSDTEVVGPSDTFTGANRGNDTGGKTEREYAEQGGALKKKGMPGAGPGKSEKTQAEGNAEDTPGAGPNLGGQSVGGLRGWQKPRKGTSPPLPWDNNPGPTVPKMARLSGGEHDWQRSGYHAVPDPDKLVE